MFTAQSEIKCLATKDLLSLLPNNAFFKAMKVSSFDPEVQLVEWSLPTPKDLCSSPAIINFYKEYLLSINCIEKTKLNMEKEAGSGSFKMVLNIVFRRSSSNRSRELKTILEKKCDKVNFLSSLWPWTVWPDVGLNSSPHFSKSCSKSSQCSIYIGVSFFKNSPKGCHHFELLLLEFCCQEL